MTKIIHSKNYKIIENERVRAVRSAHYNYNFDKVTGLFARWGATPDEDPAYSPYGPEILDLEISSGECAGNCKFCYKDNGMHQKLENMSFDTFKKIFDNMNTRSMVEITLNDGSKLKGPEESYERRSSKESILNGKVIQGSDIQQVDSYIERAGVLTQIAFGICDVWSNPDMFKMFEYCRNNEYNMVIPNYTCNGIGVTDEIAHKTASLCGAVAVSLVNKEKSYDAIDKFTSAGMNQVNIHYMLSNETYERAFKIVDDIKSDPRLSKMNAIVFLQYKPKGANLGTFSCIDSTDKYEKLVKYCEDNGVAYGFDSCSAPSWFKSIASKPNWKEISQIGEPCESTCISSYINYKGQFFPCSFTEGTKGWEDDNGIDVVNCTDFLKDVWFNERVNKFREVLLKSSSDCNCKFNSLCRSCPVYDISPCKRK
jgi:sulfatase maturation enzyme AslB (radical SAM superfamily)